MSTKTSLKKIAVIAAMALTLGGFTAISANAANEVTFTISGTNTSGTGTALDPFIAVANSGPVTIDATVTPAITASVLTGTLPAGLVFTGTTGDISGTPTAAKSATMYTVTTTGSPVKDGSFYLAVVSAAPTTGDQPFTALEPDDTGTYDPVTKTLSISKTVTSAETLVRLVATSDTAMTDGLDSSLNGSYRYLKITSGNSTFSNATSTGDGSTAWQVVGTLASGTGSTYVPGTSTFMYAPLNGSILNDQIHVRAAVTGTVTVVFGRYDAAPNPIDPTKPLVTDTKLQTISIQVTAPTALDPSKSTSVLRANNDKLDSTGGVASSCQISEVAVPPAVQVDQLCGNTWSDSATEADETVIAPQAISGNSSGVDDGVASIKVRLLDKDRNLIVGTLPSIEVVVDGPGLVNISTDAPYGSSVSGTSGRRLTQTAASANEFWINIFSDGNAGKSTIAINVAGGPWKTETLSFYGAAKTVKATQGLFILPTGTVAGGAYGCAGLACDGTSVGLSVASTLTVTDALGTPVPYRSLTATTSDSGVLSAVATATPGDAYVPFLGVHHFKVTVPYAATATSGKSAALTYVLGTGATAVPSNPLTFALGGAAATVTISLSGNPEVGALNEITVEAKDAAGNKAFDKDHLAKLTSNVVVNTAANSDQDIFRVANGVIVGDTVPVWNGTGTVKFFNPIVPTTLVIGGTVGGAAVSATAAISNSALTAAADAAAEAIDAANAATDAANAAAEAADAATAAAQDAADAVAALSAQVSTLINALRKQLIALTNLVIKIQKKVRA